MSQKTLIWRVVVVLLLAGATWSGYLAYQKVKPVDTEAMLDVSVSIKAFSHVRTDEVGDSVWDANIGSGFMVSVETCEVWTARHVIADAAIIEVYPRGGSDAIGIPATVINATPRSDIAMLRMKRCDGLTEAKLGNSDKLRQGEATYAVGNPRGNNPDSISRGIISHTKRYVVGAIPYLQTDAMINFGSSGGALFNRRGEVVGINVAIAITATGQNAGIGYAIPINVAREVTDKLRDGPPSWGDVGISEILSPLTTGQATMFRVPDGLQAVSLTKDPVEGTSVGKLRARDVIFKIDGQPVNGVDHANRVISHGEPGETMRFQLVRDGEVASVDVTVGEGWTPSPTPEPEPYEGYLGMSLEMWADRDDGMSRFKNPVITRVYNLGPAHRSHIASSQSAVGRRGPFWVPFQLDVKTITGVVLGGVYGPVPDVESLERYAADASERGVPILLEIEMWARRSGPETPLSYIGTRFFKLSPVLFVSASTETETSEEEGL